MNRDTRGGGGNRRRLGRFICLPTHTQSSSAKHRLRSWLEHHAALHQHPPPLQPPGGEAMRRETSLTCRFNVSLDDLALVLSLFAWPLCHAWRRGRLGGFGVARGGGRGCVCFIPDLIKLHYAQGCLSNFYRCVIRCLSNAEGRARWFWLYCM